MPRSCEESQSWWVYRTPRSREKRWDSSMYLSAWNDDWLPVSWWNTNRLQMDRGESSPCACVFASNSRKSYTFARSEDCLNTCGSLCSPDAILSRLKGREETKTFSESEICDSSLALYNGFYTSWCHASTCWITLKMLSHLFLSEHTHKWTETIKINA